jgi:hypothetical protein
MLSRLAWLLPVLVICACAATPMQKELTAVHGVALETLQGAVNISLTSAAGQMSGNGVLVYRRPENFRLTVLAPFGQSLLDMIVTGEQVLCLVESRKQGWQGNLQELPDRFGRRLWPLMNWVMEPPHPAGPALERTFLRNDGLSERVYYDAAGFVQRKVNAYGDEVVYSDYRLVDGVALPHGITLKTAEGNILGLVLDEPEVNRPVDSALFSPPLDRYAILPLADFKGF